MTKHFYTVKKLPLWIAVSAVILAVGIALFAIFGFNTNTQAGKSFELTYDAVVTIADGGDRVIIYLKKEKARKILPPGWNVDASRELLGKLTQFYGEKNVKVVEKTIEKTGKMN